ncbi:hypothetical protein Tco_0607578 [Tanacetum coccineum]
MNQAITKQVALDEALVSTDDRVTIGSCNMRINPIKTQKEPTYQVVLDVLKLSPCYNAFLITADLDNKKFKIGVELFREILRIYPRVPNTEFVAPPPHDAIVTFIKSLAELLWEDFQYQINYRQISVRRRESMPYPRFTKVIIHHFLSKHKSISKRQGLFMNSIKDDAVMGRLKFVSKGEENQVYRMSILDVMVNGDIKNLKAYQTYLAIPTRFVILKKVRKGIKTPATPKKKGSIIADENILSDPDEATELAVTMRVDKQADERQKKRKMKGIVTDAIAEELLNLKKGTRKSREDYILQQIPKGSSEGSSTKPSVPDKPKSKSKGSSSDEEEIILSTDDERTESETEVVEREKSDEETFDEDKEHSDEELCADDEAHDEEYVHDDDEKHDDADKEMNDAENADEQAGTDQTAKDDQPGAQISKTRKEKHEVPPSSSNLSLSSNYAPLLDVLVSVIPPQTTTTPIPTPLTTPLPTPPIKSEAPTVTITLPDPLLIVLQRLSDLESKFEAWTKADYSEAIKESVQANIINEIKNQLPKFLSKVVSNFVNLRIESIVRDVLQNNPAFLSQSSLTPAQPTSRAVESISELELKKILFDKMDKI